MNFTEPEPQRVFRRAAVVALVAVVWLPVAVVLAVTWDSPGDAPAGSLADAPDAAPESYSPCLGAPPAEQLPAEAPDLPCSPCNRVEIYVHNLAAAGKKGSNAGFEGSGLGCVPACVWLNDRDSAVEPEEVRFLPVIPEDMYISGSSGGYVVTSAGRDFDQGNFLFQTSRTVFRSTYSDDADGTLVGFASSDPDAIPTEVWLTPDQQSCQVYDARGHIVVS